MLADIEAARSAGLAGVVLGASLSDGRLDGFVLETLAKAAVGLDLTLHRAFDLVPDISQAVEIAVKLGFSRILTSGRASTALSGIEDLRRAIAASGKRISIMPGAGISPENARLFLDLELAEVHASCSAPVDRLEGDLAAFGFSLPTARRTDANKIRALRAALGGGAPNATA